MLRADHLVKAHLLPRSVSDSLSDTVARGFSTPSQGQHTYAWVLHRQALLVWRVEDGFTAALRRLELPEAPVGRTFVEVVPQPQSSAVTVIACTGAGRLYVWLDATFVGQPYSQQLATSSSDSSSDEIICAVTAIAADVGDGPGFLAVLGTSDGALHLYHGSQSGIFPRQFYNPTAPSSTRGGVLGLLGQTAKMVMSEGQLFFGASLYRNTASTTPAQQLQLQPQDGRSWKLLVLTADALDCWKVGTSSSKQSSDDLLWSYSVYQAVLGKQRTTDVRVLAFTASTPSPPGTAAAGAQANSDAPGAGVSECIYVWSAHLHAESALRYQHTCSAFAVEDGPQKGPRLVDSQQLDTAGPLPTTQDGRQAWQLVTSSRHQSCLLLSPNGVLLVWRPGQERPPSVLSTTSDNLAVTCSQRSHNWQLLNAAYGVLEVASDSLIAGAQQDRTGAARGLLDRVLQVMYQEASAGYQYRELATGLADCLSALGMLRTKEGNSLLLHTSRSLVDSLPTAGTLDLDSFRSMLSEKQVRHDLLLTALQVGGVLQQLPALVLAALFEHAQMLAAAARVLEWQRGSTAAAAAQRGGVSQQGAEGVAAKASGDAITAAGMQAAAGAGDTVAAAGQEVEVFFGRPTVSIPALFNTAATAAAQLRQAAAEAAEHSAALPDVLQQLLGLCGLLLAAAGAADAKQAALRQEVLNEVSRAEACRLSWLAAEGPRAAWTELAEGCLLVLPRLPGLPQQQQLARQAHLPSLCRLLDGLASALRVTADPLADLLAAYQELPWRHGRTLLVVAEQELPGLEASGVLDVVEPDGVQDTGPDVLAALPGLTDTLVWPLQALAQRHRCWELLFATCGLVSSIHPLLRDQLQQQMARECAACGAVLEQHGFTRYVMQRLHAQHDIVGLLQLGREGFTPQLQHYLADCPALLWMSQVQVQQYDAAMTTLHRAASTAAAPDAKRLWCLTKLAAKAAGATAGQDLQLLGSATVRLRQIALQEQLLPGGAAGGPVAPEALAAAALRAAERTAGAAAAGDDGEERVGLWGADAAVAAVEVLALDAGSSGSESYRQLWQSSWRAVLRCTPLADLAAERAAVAQGGWQSDAYQAAVRDSPLFQAFVAAVAGLQDAAQAVRDVNVRERLQAVVDDLQEGVQGPEQLEVFEDIKTAAADAAQLSA